MTERRKENAGMLRYAQHDNSGSAQRDKVGALAVCLAGFAVMLLAGDARATTTDPQLDAGFRAMYALDFVSSQKSFAGYERAHPEIRSATPRRWWELSSMS